MKTPKTSTPPEPATPRDDSGLFDLAALTGRYPAPPEPRREDYAVGMWTPGPMLEPAPRRFAWAASLRWVALAPLLAALVFGLGHVSGALATGEIGGAPVTPVTVTLDRKVSPVDEPSPQPSLDPVVEPEPEAEPEPEVVAEVVAEATPAPNRRARTPRPTTPARTTPPRTTPANPATSWETGGADEAPIDRSLDDLLDAALGEPSAETATPSAVLPRTPTARQVRLTLDALSGEVAQCADTGQVTARVVVNGDTGRVRSADVSGSPEAACMERVLETARFPRFSQDTFTVLFPYRW